MSTVTPAGQWVCAELCLRVGAGYIWQPRWAGLVSCSSWIYLVVLCKMLLYICGALFSGARVYLVCRPSWTGGKMPTMQERHFSASRTADMCDIPLGWKMTERSRHKDGQGRRAEQSSRRVQVVGGGLLYDDKGQS